VFCALVRVVLPHRWFWWSIAGSALIVFLLWFQVRLDVMINNGFGTFFNVLQ
jgi:peptide/bleomycin uptake transporter